MTGNCIDHGTIQAFLDGELSPANAGRVSAHISDCDACSALLARVEDESAFVFSVLEREIDSMVPTQRLWSRINESIEIERHNTPFWKKAWALISTQLLNPSFAAAAGLLVVGGLAFGVWMERGRIDQPVPQETAATVRPANATPTIRENTIPLPDIAPEERDVSEAARPEPIRTSLRPERRVVEAGSSAPRPVTASYIAGEESYVKTIANLSENVNSNKDVVMRPSERIAFEKDMAVLNDAIDKMRKEVRRNPKNESAKQVLYSSYQNKIDLLNSVSLKEELVASLK